MLKDIHIQNYRGIKDLKIKDFKRINLLVGDNNSSKTSVLEAIFITANYDISGVIAFEAFRENGRLPVVPKNPQDPEVWEGFENLFYEKNIRDGFEIESTHDFAKIKLKATAGSEVVRFENSQISPAIINRNLVNNLTAKYTENDQNPATLGYSRDGNYCGFSNLCAPTLIYIISSVPAKPSELAPMMDKIAQSNDEGFLSDLAQKIDPTIKNIKSSGQRILADIGKISIDLKYCGEGLTSVLNILLRMREVKNGILLIDEIENGLHWKTQKVLWRAVIAAAKKNNVQIIATTHSQEMIKALSEVCEEDASDIDGFSVFSLDKDGDKNYVNTYAGEDLKFRLNAGGEIR